VIRRLGFQEDSVPYEGQTQRARFWTENWVAAQLYCLNCGRASINKLPNNQPVADFQCPDCREEYELKSQAGKIGGRIVDGAHKSMLERLAADNNPNLVLLAYNRPERSVTDLAVVPKQFFVPEIIEGRKPLAPTAKRAGWIGCNILLNRIPDAGKIVIVRNGVLEAREVVLEKWRQICFVREQSTAARGWLLEVMKCVEDIRQNEFELADVYRFEPRLQSLYPGNQHVREKMRQQLQALRDGGFIEFLGRGKYRLRLRG
jgi:type II restriction enzyme